MPKKKESTTETANKLITQEASDVKVIELRLDNVDEAMGKQDKKLDSQDRKLDAIIKGQQDTRSLVQKVMNEQQSSNEILWGKGRKPGLIFTVEENSAFIQKRTTVLEIQKPRLERAMKLSDRVYAYWQVVTVLGVGTVVALVKSLVDLYK